MSKNSVMTGDAICRTTDCGKPATVRLRGMCEHEHLTENVYCDEHGDLLRGIGEREGYFCYECRQPFDGDRQPWHHDCLLGLDWAPLRS